MLGLVEGEAYWILACKRMNLDPCLIPYTKMNSKCVRDCNVKTKTIKLLEEKLGINICDFRQCFLHMTPKAQEIKNCASSMIRSFVPLLSGKTTQQNSKGIGKQKITL